jgi:AraC-like DNA-binding protein
MMGLWSRPIRAGALKNLCSYMRGASSLAAALFRFTSFWNMVLDDFSVVLDQDAGALRLRLVARDQATPQRFGHMLLLKLAHGIASWLAGRELALSAVAFGFARPAFAEDYPILFPAPIRFGQGPSAIVFADDLSAPPLSRSEADMQEFLLRAPRDWIFTDHREHALPLRLREMLLRSDRMSFRLRDAAQALNTTERTLMRRLDDEATSFQAIKDGLRRDIALRDLASGVKSIEAMSQDLGYSSAANFHRAFKTWTGVTPGAYGARSR